MAQAPIEPESLADMLSREDTEIAALLKNAGVDSEDDGLIDTSGETEKVPPVQVSEKEINDGEPTPEEIKEEKPEPVVKEPEPEKEVPLEVKPEPITEPAPEIKPEPKKERVPVWKALRDSQRKSAQLEAENVELKRQQAEAKKREEAGDVVEQVDEDPIARLENNQKILDKRLLEQAEQIRQQRVTDAVKSDEERFIKDHPDYHDALNHIVVKARTRFANTGDLEEKMEEVIAKHDDVIQKVLLHKGVASPTDDDFYKAAEDIAFAVLFEQERQKFVTKHIGKGRSVAEAAYKLAEDEGWEKPNGGAAEVVVEAAPAAPAKTKTESAQERVQRQAKIAVATQSLSAMQNGGPARNQLVKSKTQFMQMAPEAQDKLIEAMEEIDPDWIQKLPD